MGTYLNPGSKGFQESLNSDIYVDKTGLIEKTNAKINTLQKYLCISRPRRFGKSMAANMLAAYYDRETDSRHLFKHFQVSRITSYEEHRNQYDVIRVNIQEFLSVSHEIDEMLKLLQERLILELKRKYPEYVTQNNLMFAMQDVYAFTQHPFIILIDEWDCLFREYQHDQNAQKKYLDFLRSWLKDKEYVALAYMTGILPIKKYGSHSALNMFTEYSMTDPGDLAEYFGFTEDEVKKLCAEYQMNYEETKAWYDGYHLRVHQRTKVFDYAMYNPKSVVEAMMRHKYGTYWNRTETYEALKVYIQMNYGGLKEAIVRMLAGDRVQINTGTFSNDMTTFETKDDVLTLLVHLGYLSYHWPDKTVTIPNKEVYEIYKQTFMAYFEDYTTSRKNKLYQELIQGDTKKVNLLLNDILLRSISYFDNQESFYHGFLVGLLNDYEVTSNREAGHGRFDVCVLPDSILGTVVLIECKHSISEDDLIDDAREGVQQIIDQKYLEERRFKKYENVVGYGISFYKKQCYVVKMNNNSK